MTIRAPRLVPHCAAALLLLVLASAPVPAQTDPRMYPGNSAVEVPPATEAGSFAGTWIYASRDARVAIWITQVDGRWELRYRYFSTAFPEGFETDWHGHAEYFVREFPGVFDLTLNERSDDRLAGTWNWTLDLPGAARGEHASVELFRSGNGLTLILHFENFAYERREATRTRRAEAEQIWSFRKASNRLVLWDELPF